MRRALAYTCIAALTTTLGVGVASAEKAGSPGHPGNKGLCNAYEHNNQNGKTHGQAFIRLAETAGDYDGDGDRDQDDVRAYCAANVPAVGK